MLSRAVALLTFIFSLRHMSDTGNKFLRRGLRPIGSNLSPQFASFGVLGGERLTNGLFHFGANLRIEQTKKPLLCK